MLGAQHLPGAKAGQKAEFRIPVADRTGAVESRAAIMEVGVTANPDSGTADYLK